MLLIILERPQLFHVDQDQLMREMRSIQQPAPAGLKPLYLAAYFCASIQLTDARPAHQPGADHLLMVTLCPEAAAELQRWPSLEENK